MADRLLDSGLVHWVDQTAGRDPIKRENLVLTERGQSVSMGFEKHYGSNRPLGRNQTMALQNLDEIGPWSPLGILSGWVLDNDSETLKVMKSLEKRGLVDKKNEYVANRDNVERFYINDAGRGALDCNKCEP